MKNLFHTAFTCIILAVGWGFLGLSGCSDDNTVAANVDTLRVFSKDTLYIKDTTSGSKIDTTILDSLYPRYTGSKSCDTCHKEHYAAFSESGHPFKLTPVEGGSAPTYPAFVTVPKPTLPPGQSWSNISYVIGGYLKSAMFLNDSGFLLLGPNKMEYTCGKCHATGYKPFGNQGGLAGIKGTWAEPGVQCEACHGPGSHHIKTKGLVPMEKDASADLCGKCHTRGRGDLVAKFGGTDSAIIESHAQYNEFSHSKMASMSCVSCHNPHASAHYDDAAGNGIHTACATCHAEEAMTYKTGTLHLDSAGIGCEACHMPKLDGSLRTHLFRIATDTALKQYSNDSVANPWISLESACLGCHGDTTYAEMPKSLQSMNLAWAAQYAKSIHRKPSPKPNRYAGKGVCATCHSKTVQGWSRSGHGKNVRADSISPGRKYDYIHGFLNGIPAFGGACQACHVTGYGEPSGWTDDVHKAGATTADSMRLESVQCEACHGPASAHATDGKASLGPVNYNSSCQKCHVGTFNQDLAILGPADSATVVTARGLTHRQSLIYNGVQGYEYPGKPYKHSAHATEVTRGCVTCHMFPGTRHSVDADKEACMNCHAGFKDTVVASGPDSLRFNLGGAQDTVSIRIRQLSTLLDSALALAASTADSTTIKAAFPYQAARYNLDIVSADKSRGIHDYKYVRQLLEDAIADSARYLHILPPPVVLP